MGTITIVDDDQLILDGMSHALRAEGYWVETFKDPIVALPKVIFEPPRLLILNGRMPRMHGIDFFQQYRRYSRRSVLICSASADKIAETLAALGQPADAYLAKPFSLRALTALVAAQMSR
jgi:DNA-binding response OmpR family regulator